MNEIELLHAVNFPLDGSLINEEDVCNITGVQVTAEQGKFLVDLQIMAEGKSAIVKRYFIANKVWFLRQW